MNHYAIVGAIRKEIKCEVWFKWIPCIDPELNRFRYFDNSPKVAPNCVPNLSKFCVPKQLWWYRRRSWLSVRLLLDRQSRRAQHNVWNLCLVRCECDMSVDEIHNHRDDLRIVHHPRSARQHRILRWGLPGFWYYFSRCIFLVFVLIA